MNIFNKLVETGKRGVKIQVVQNIPSHDYPDTDTVDLAAMGVAEVLSLNVSELFPGGGILHTKLWVVDGRHFYMGSANMDWRSLTQVRDDQGAPGGWFKIDAVHVHSPSLPSFPPLPPSLPLPSLFPPSLFPPSPPLPPFSLPSPPSLPFPPSLPPSLFPPCFLFCRSKRWVFLEWTVSVWLGMRTGYFRCTGTWPRHVTFLCTGMGPSAPNTT